MDPKLVRTARELVPNGELYCDWAASALSLPPCAPVFIPPHHASSATVDSARAVVREFLGDRQENYHIVFTGGTTASFQLLAYRIPWSSDDSFVCHRHVHNAVLGIRNVAISRCASFVSIPTKDMICQRKRHRTKEMGFAVFAFPAECNLTGATYPLSWASSVKQDGILGYPGHKVITIVDTAKFLANKPLSLRDHPHIDGLVLSLYKLSSTYTGLGVLLIRKESLLAELLHSSADRCYFGGQASDAITPFSNSLYVPSPSLECILSTGTPNLQAIHALPEQLAHLSDMSSIHTYTTSIGRRFRGLLLSAFSGAVIHADPLVEHNPATTSFTLFRGGSPVGHHEIATILSLHGVHVRAGTMCNIGATASMLGFSDQDLVELHKRGYRCGEGADVIDGRGTGVVRVSFGWGSLVEDADAVVRVLKEYIVVDVERSILCGGQKVVQKLFVYPVKGCPGMEVESLKCAKGGIYGNRAFGVIDLQSRKILDIKSCPQLLKIDVQYERENNGEELVFYTENTMSRIHVEDWLQSDWLKPDSRTCGYTFVESDCVIQTKEGAELREATEDESLSKALGRSVGLIRLHGHKRDALVVTEYEIQNIAKESGIEANVVIRALRPNVVLSGRGVSADFTTLNGPVVMTRLRRCTRCTTVNIVTGVGDGEPLRSIARICRYHGGGIVMGSVMRVSTGAIRKGDQVNVT